MEADDDEHPEDSAGAQCIRFKLLTHQFGPTFVHQVFPDELIPGYLPAPWCHDAIEESSFSINTSKSPRLRSHPSFRGRRATKYLTIVVNLTASCQNISLTLEALPIPDAQDNNCNNKRRKLNNDDDEDIGSEDSDTEEEDLESVEDNSVDEEEWTLDHVRTVLEPFLPPSSPTAASRDRGDDQNSGQFLPAPIGKEVTSYTMTTTKGNGQSNSFVVTIATAAECATYHSGVQKLAYWFIDAASDIDLTESSTEWKVLYLFQKHENEKDTTAYSLVGFMTLYHFASPFRKEPAAGCIVRVCQALVLPPYQRRGHGQRMLESVFRYAQSSIPTTTTPDADAEPIVEVNCEDPAPGFQLLRTVVDYERFVTEGRTWFNENDPIDNDNKNADPAANDNNNNQSSSKWLLKPLRESMKLSALQRSLTTATQIQKVYEIELLRSLEQQQPPPPPKDADALMQQYKTIVRSRLGKDHADELIALDEANEASVRLEELVRLELEHHATVLRRCVHPPKTPCVH
jgi:histone acetyltransferase 1